MQDLHQRICNVHLVMSYYKEEYITQQPSNYSDISQNPFYSTGIQAILPHFRCKYQ